MIHLHRLNSSEVVVNAELIVSIEALGAETVLTLATGNTILVREPVTEIIHKTIEYKKNLYASAVHLPEFLKGEGGSKPCHSHS